MIAAWAFRISIWDVNGTKIYDNHATASKDTDATTTLRGGSIVIHKK